MGFSDSLMLGVRERVHGRAVSGPTSSSSHEQHPSATTRRRRRKSNERIIEQRRRKGCEDRERKGQCINLTVHSYFISLSVHAPSFDEQDVPHLLQQKERREGREDTDKTK